MVMTGVVPPADSGQSQLTDAHPEKMVVVESVVVIGVVALEEKPKTPGIYLIDRDGNELPIDGWDGNTGK